MLFDPTGQLVGEVSGEGHYAVLDQAIGRLVQEHRARGTLNETPLRFFPENEKSDSDPLLFPGKVLADAAGGRLFIADTGHNRLVVSDLAGKGPVTIGNGEPGLVDGSYEKAAFNRPQGMCLVGETLYVADTENHALRAVDLQARTVATVAGTGEQSHLRSGSGPGKSTGLNSPWDVVQVPATPTLLMAMAGPHQIWKYDIDTQTVSVYAGTGAENIIDGRFAIAAFAQPSGLATDGRHLFVADSEVSGIRAVTLKDAEPRVHTIVGRGLFQFGDRDGSGGAVRLQHCLGLAYGDGKLYIADTYNNKVKVCDPQSRTVRTLSGDGHPGASDNPARFYQPGGLSLAGSTLYVADTNNGKIRTIDLRTGTVKTLPVDGLQPPRPRPSAPRFPNALVTEVPARVAPGPEIAFAVNLNLRPREKLNKDAPMPLLIETPGQSGILAGSVSPTGQKLHPPAVQFPVKVPLAQPARAGDSVQVRLSVSAFVCDEGSNLCRIKSYVWNIPVTFDKDGQTSIELKPKAL
jgi:DNA-binding beta-propeller fold protein YncE